MIILPKEDINFCHINGMIITTINDKMNITNEQNIKQPMQAVELRKIMNIAKKTTSL